MYELLALDANAARMKRQARSMLPSMCNSWGFNCCYWLNWLAMEEMLSWGVWVIYVTSYRTLLSNIIRTRDHFSARMLLFQSSAGFEKCHFWLGGTARYLLQHQTWCCEWQNNVLDRSVSGLCGPGHNTTPKCGSRPHSCLDHTSQTSLWAANSFSSGSEGGAG